jgi:3-(3-hydroxy-phenyl)propionate hydroxylase
VHCEFEWCSVYTFRCARLAHFVAGRVLFAGDSAHVVSPFGARGGNGGIQDVDNLCWKLALILRGQAPAGLLASYDQERGFGADENIVNSARTTTFMTPKTAAERHLRDGVLGLAPRFPFARALVNSGRLSKPCALKGFPGFAADDGTVAGPMQPGVPCDDAPLEDADGRPTWLLKRVGGAPTALLFGDDAPAVAEATRARVAASIQDLRIVVISQQRSAAPGLEVLVDRAGIATARYGGAPGVTYLIRPDQHVLGRWRRWDLDALREAWRHCLWSAGT